MALTKSSMMPKIESKELTSDDIGRNVTYKSNHALDDPKQWEREL